MNLSTNFRTELNLLFIPTDDVPPTFFALRRHVGGYWQINGEMLQWFAAAGPQV